MKETDRLREDEETEDEGGQNCSELVTAKTKYK